MTTDATSIYTLFPRDGGGFSVRIVDYDGVEFKVCATSVRQAYAVAHHVVWIKPADDRPVGIVSIYRRQRGVTLWCGCTGHRVTGGVVRHGAGISALRQAIKAHRCPRQQLTLRERLLAAAYQAGGMTMAWTSAMALFYVSAAAWW